MTLLEIKAFIVKLEKDESDFKNKSISVFESETKPKNYGELAWFYFHSMADCFSLFFFKRKLKNKHLVYTAKNFCVSENGQLEDRIVKSILKSDVVFINHSKEYFIERINQQKVYNIGGLVKILSKLFFWKHEPRFRIFLSYQWVNNLILNGLNSKVYTLCYYDLNGLSLIFLRHRSDFELCEVQHGSIVNYPPYTIPSPVKTADTFFVKNQYTIDYLKKHLCKHFDCDYKLLPYPIVHRKLQKGIPILYASTVEFNGFHPVFQSFLERNKLHDISLTIRLHPREIGKEHLFLKHLNGIKHQFDTSSNWLENTLISNTIVISPWSSCIEDAFDNDFVSIIIDPVGRVRYRHLIDGHKCFYSENLLEMISNLQEIER